MRLPSRIVDISMPLDNETVVDPDFMRPRIEYQDGDQTAPLMLNAFPGLRKEDLPNGKAWAWEWITLTTHNGTHMDAPYHYNPVDVRGNRMSTIDEIPLDWCFRPGVKLDFRDEPDGHVITAEEVEKELARIEHELQPRDIVLVNTRASEYYGTDEYLHRGVGMGREATLYLTQRGVRVTGIDGWSWDAPFSLTQKRWAETRDPSLIWEGHYAGMEIPYCHMEKLQNLEELPPKGFWVAAFPCKIKGASGGWTRAVALFD